MAPQRNAARLWPWLRCTGTFCRVELQRLPIRHSSYIVAGGKERPMIRLPPSADKAMLSPAARLQLRTLSSTQGETNQGSDQNGETKQASDQNGETKQGSDPVPEDDPQVYTSGRWLYRDKLEREARYLQFDFTALSRKVVEVSPGARRVVQHERKDGEFNRGFVFILDNGMRVVAKLPTFLAGPRRLATNSEVATMTYCKYRSP